MRYVLGYFLAWFVLGIVFAIAFPAHAQTPNVGCTQKAIFDSSTSGAIQLVAAVTGNSVRVCSFVMFAGGTTTGKLVYGTGSTCGTGTTDLTPAFPLTVGLQVALQSPYFQGIAAPPGNALCVTLGSSAKLVGLVTYSQSP